MSGLFERMTSSGFVIYLFVVGAILATTAVGLFIKGLRISAGLRADGEIVGYHQRIQQSRGMKQQFMPLVRFSPRGGAPIEFQSGMSADPGRWPEGTRVSVVYRGERPEQAEIATGARLWLAPPAILLFALGCFATAWKAGG